MRIPTEEVSRSELIYENTDVNVFKFKQGTRELVLKELFITDDDSIDLISRIQNRVDNEIDIMSTLDHPNVMKLRGIVTEQPIFGMIMDYMPKGTLQSFIENLNEQWEDQSRFTMAFGMACGLRYLHAQNIIHRDLKSENILIKADDTPKISDFDVSVKLEEGQEVYIHADQVGTFGWQAPEALKPYKHSSSKRAYSKATDVYSFATLLWVMYSFAEPYPLCENATWLDKLAHKSNVSTNITSGGHVDEERITEPSLKKLCLKAWSLAPKERPPIDEIVSELKKLTI